MALKNKKIILIISIILISICTFSFVILYFTSYFGFPLFNPHPKGDEIPLGLEWRANEYSITLKTNSNDPFTSPHGEIVIDNNKYQFDFHLRYGTVAFSNTKTDDIILSATYSVDKNQNIVLKDISYVDEYNWTTKPKKIVLVKTGDGSRRQ